MKELVDYVKKHAVRGTCKCGDCIDHPGVDAQPSGHTADVFFFEVAATEGASAEELAALIERNKNGEWADIDLLNGSEHSYIHIGGWIGDQGLALMLMGLGSVLGLWRLMTPKMLPGLPEPLMQQMADQGMVSIQKVSL